jgi:recombination protein RecA
VLDLAMEHDLIQKSGSFFSYGETRLGQGRNNTKEFLRDNPELAAELEGKINEKLGIGQEEAEKPRPEAEKAADKAKAVKAVAEAETEAEAESETGSEQAEEPKRQARKPQKKAA